jgi:hypothetical protein
MPAVLEFPIRFSLGKGTFERLWLEQVSVKWNKKTQAMAIFEERFKDAMVVLDYSDRYRYTYDTYA